MIKLQGLMLVVVSMLVLAIIGCGDDATEVALTPPSPGTNGGAISTATPDSPLEAGDPAPAFAALAAGGQ